MLMKTGELTATLANLILVADDTQQMGEIAGAIANGPPRIWLPFLDTYRTMCLAPQPEFRQLLEQARDLPIAA